MPWPEAGNKGSPLEDNARDDILPLVALQGASSEGSSGTDSQMTNNTDWLEVAAKASMRWRVLDSSSVEDLGTGSGCPGLEQRYTGLRE